MVLEKNEAIKFIGKLAIFAAIFLIIAGVAYVLVPYEQKLILFSESYFESFHKLPYPYFFFWFFMFLQAMVMIGIVSMFSNLDTKFNAPFFYWISKLAMLGYLLMGLTYISRLYYMPKVTREYFEGSDVVKEVIIADGTMEFDKFLMSFGFAALWFFVLGVYSVKYKLFNRVLRILNFVCSFGYGIALVGYFVQERVLTTSSSVLTCFFPIWSYSLYSYTKNIMKSQKK